MLGTRKHTIAFPTQPLSTSSSTVPELQPISRSAAFRHQPAAQSAKTKETESKDEKPLHRRGGAGNDLPKIGPDIRNI